MNSERTEKPTLLFWLFGAAFAIRFAAGLLRHAPLSPGGDSGSYIHMAEWFLGRASSMVLDHPPVYPLFLAITYVALQQNWVLALALQSLVSALCVPLVAAFSGILHPDRRVGPLAAGWVIVDPFLIYFSTLFLSESLFTTLLIAGLVCWLKAWWERKPRWAGGAGLLLSLAALCRSVLSPFLILFAMGPLFWSGLPWPRRFVATINLMLCMALPLVAWSLFLHQKTGDWVLISAQKGWNTYEGLNEDFDSPDGVARWQAQMEKESAERGLFDPLQRDAYFWQKSKDAVCAHPGAMLRLMARKFFKFWRLQPYFPYSKTQRIISAVFMLPFIFFSLVGAFQLIAHPDRPRALVCLPLVFIFLYALLNTLTWTQIRYRMPMHPLLAFYAAVGVLRLKQSLSSGA